MGQSRAAAGGGRGGDCLIKLFGKTISVPDAGDVDKDLQHDSSSMTEPRVQENIPQDSMDSHPLPEATDSEDASAVKNSSAEQEEQQQADTANQKEKLKKPDKILPCPRCSSMDTKFCYYNNYNINQPRHLCKNCQRYWTAGGAMRTVPVGAGRRKNKSVSIASQFLQRVSSALPGDTPVKTNGTVLSFSSDTCHTSTLDLTEQMKHPKENLIQVTQIKNTDGLSAGSCAEGLANGEDLLNQMNSRVKSTAEKSTDVAPNSCMNGGAMWPFSCAPSPAYVTSSVAIPFYHPAAAAYWGCMVPGAWNTPWPPQSQSQSGSPTSAASPVSTMSSCFQSRKHPRDGDEERNANGDGKVWVPKTIRIDEADEVSKSSIWSLIGIKSDKAGEDDGRGCKLARVFDPKDEAKTAAHRDRVINSMSFLKGNPAAFSRSTTFQERS